MKKKYDHAKGTSVYGTNGYPSGWNALNKIALQNKWTGMNRINLQSSTLMVQFCWWWHGRQSHIVIEWNALPFCRHSPDQSSNYGNDCNLIISTLRRVPVIRWSSKNAAWHGLTDRRRSDIHDLKIYIWKLFRCHVFNQDQGKVNLSGCWHGSVVIACFIVTFSVVCRTTNPSLEQLEHALFVCHGKSCWSFL